jgi:hypothetical protein
MSAQKGSQPKLETGAVPPTQAPPRARPHRILWAIIIAFCTLAGGLAAALTLLPRVTATISEPADPADPFSSSVTITNTGYLPLNSVAGFVRVKELRYGSLTDPIVLNTDNGSYDLALDAGRLPVHLGLDDRFSFDIHQYLPHLPPVLSRANISITVRYTIPLIHLTREKLFPAVAVRQHGGTFRWQLLAPES